MTPVDTPIAKRLAELISMRGTTARETSVAAGLSPDACRNIIVGRSGAPRSDTLEAISRVLRVTPLTLIDPSSPVVELAAPAHRRFAPTPVPASQIFSDEELALLAALGVEVRDGPQVLVFDPATGERRNLVAPFWSRDSVRLQTWGYVDAAHSALKEAMNRVTP